MSLKINVYLLWFCAAVLQIQALDSVWQWKCTNGYCLKSLINTTDEATSMSIAECHQTCSNFSGLFPAPTGNLKISKELVKVKEVKVTTAIPETSPIYLLVKSAEETIFHKKTPTTNISEGVTLELSFQITDQVTNRLNINLDESYKITISSRSEEIVAIEITSVTNYGFRHAIETMNQLVILDDLRNVIKIPKTAEIEDKPKFPHRGIALDTSRNFINIDVIKNIIIGMGASKMNALHWHITDSQSFPYVSKSLPDLSKYGAYTAQKVYTSDDIKELVKFANGYGVKIIPEFDAPAHVGEGWQNTDFVTCFNWQPWDKYCVQAPCGQFDPTKDGLYDVLSSLFKDMLEDFDPDVFHMGGDEVHFACWNNTDNIITWMEQKGWGRTEEDFIKLWNHFQVNALEKLEQITGKDMKIIMWTSTLTNKDYLSYLPREKYIIQVWTDKTDESVKNLLENNYTLIMSNYDSLYLDCGYGSWVGTGNNWCSPYSGWTKIYDNDYKEIAGDRINQIIGAEVAMWTEQVDSMSVESKIWPRAAALAERLWSDPVITNYKDAEQRILVHRERLVDLGIRADALEPEWCLQNEEQCPLIGGDDEEEIDDGGANNCYNSFFVIFIIICMNYVIITVR